MHNNYKDIKSKITEDPSWYDSNGTPRYGNFNPRNCPNIYSDQVALLRIHCGYCGAGFDVEMHTDIWQGTLQSPKKWHYGDPPIHNCVGDTMNCDDVSVLEFWVRQDSTWERRQEFEGLVD
jgi:hypothetical protein